MSWLFTDVLLTFVLDFFNLIVVLFLRTILDGVFVLHVLGSKWILFVFAMPSMKCPS